MRHKRFARRAVALAAGATLVLGVLAVGSAAAAPSGDGHGRTAKWDRNGLTATLTADAGLGATMGYSSALSADGSTAVLGAPDANQYNGAVYVFHRDGGTWHQDAVFTQTDPKYTQIGFDVAVSGDGETIVAGTGSSGGRAYVYTKSGAAWRQNAEFTTPPGDAYGLFGSDVTVSGDGATIAVGSYFRDSGKGAVYVYGRTAAGWTEPTKVSAADGAAGDYFGFQSSLSRDGKLLAVGAMGKDGEKGALYTFARTDGGWTQDAELTASDGAAGQRFAYAVALSGSGDTIVVGAPYHGTGLGYVFQRTGTSWTQTAQLVPGGKRDFPSDAISVATSGDGSVVGLGLPSRNLLYGAAALFVRDRTGYTQHATLVPSEFRGPTGGAADGLAISGDGHTTLVGAPIVASGTAFPGGAGFVYEDGAKSPGPGVVVGDPGTVDPSAEVAAPPKGVKLPPGVTLPKADTRATSEPHVAKLAGRHPILGTTHRTATVCAAPRPGYASCHAQAVTDESLTPLSTSDYQDGYTPEQLQTAYGIKGLTGSTLVAVVDAYANPDAQASLNAYRKRFGLGPIHLTQVNQDGGAELPGANAGWGTEEMLDLEMVSAACPTCPILYVGADSAAFDDLGAAVNTAVRLGAKVVSNSYGGDEWAGGLQYQAKYYQHPGVAITASSGDSGYGVSFPAAYSSVIAVGGTSLTLTASGRRDSETAWSDAGSGCSRFSAKPGWQRDRYCAHRTVADVSAVADPDTGVAVYDGANGGWLVVGGTSVSAPIIAGIYGLTGHTAGNPAQRLYHAGRHSLYDVTSGLNGTCSSAYLCGGVPGHDGPTGLGAPNGVGAF